MADQFLAEIRVFPFGFAPTGWAFCNGQLLPISQFSALFSLLGTNFGGDGKSNFGLPNLQGNVPINWGTGNGLSQYIIGEKGGSANVTVLLSQMASHPHTLMAQRSAPDNGSPNNTALAESAANTKLFTNAAAPIVQMNANAIGISGNTQPHNNLMPYLTLNFCIALQGIYPSRP